MADDIPDRLAKLDALCDGLCTGAEHERIKLAELERCDSVTRQRLNDLENFTAGKAETLESLARCVTFDDLRRVFVRHDADGNRYIAKGLDVALTISAIERERKEQNNGEGAAGPATDHESIVRPSGQIRTTSDAPAAPTLSDAMEALRKAVARMRSPLTAHHANVMHEYSAAVDSVLAAWDAMKEKR